MLEGMYAAASGMAAQQQQLDAIGNDLANASTTGYKAERVGFRDLLYNQIDQAGTDDHRRRRRRRRSDRRQPVPRLDRKHRRPAGPRDRRPRLLHRPAPGGTTALTRDGAFQVDAQGKLTTAEGDLVQPPITLPKGIAPSAVSIASDGTVTAARTHARQDRARRRSPPPNTCSPPAAASSPRPPRAARRARSPAPPPRSSRARWRDRTSTPRPRW